MSGWDLRSVVTGASCDIGALSCTPGSNIPSNNVLSLNGFSVPSILSRVGGNGGSLSLGGVGGDACHSRYMCSAPLYRSSARRRDGVSRGCPSDPE